jgi:uncharacterized protein
MTQSPDNQPNALAYATRLEQALADLGSAVVAYSGGVDSAVVLAAAQRALGTRAVGLLAVSPSYPPWEYQDAQQQAQQMGAALVVAHTREVEDPRYTQNASNRCYFCKSALFDACEEERARLGFAAIAYGANLDDLGDDRPGHQSARERGVKAPLVEAGMDKAAVRAVARHYGLSSAHKPALACLSSRFPHGTPIDVQKLAQVGQAEAALRALGFAQLRVRFHGELARVELGQDELPRLLEPAVRAAAVAGVKAAGFTHVTVDLDGYRMGGANVKKAPGRLTILA